jgi:hypothetical protein
MERHAHTGQYVCGAQAFQSISRALEHTQSNINNFEIASRVASPLHGRTFQLLDQQDVIYTALLQSEGQAQSSYSVESQMAPWS